MDKSLKRRMMMESTGVEKSYLPKLKKKLSKKYKTDYKPMSDIGDMTSVRDRMRSVKNKKTA